MANRYAVAAGGNWTANATWSTTDGGMPDTVAPTASDDVFLTSNSGNVTISATSVGKSLTCTGYTGTLTHNAFNLTISGSVTLVAGMTYTPLATSTLTINAAGTLTIGGKLLPLLVLSTGTTTLGDNLTFMDSKVITLTLNGNVLNINGKTVSGSSSTSRILIRSNTLGTSRTITNTTGTFANADFRDITLSSAADLSAITGLSGDAGGNTNITFTTPATQTATMSTNKNWSDVTIWTSRVPLPQDDVSMAGVTGGTLTADMPRLGKSIDWTGASGSPTVAHSTASTLYGSLTFISGMTVTQTTNITFEGRGDFTFTRAGRTLANSINQSMVNGSLTLQDSLVLAGTYNLTNGTLNDSGFSISCGVFQSTNSNTRAINKSGVWTLNNTSTPWIATTSTGLTFNDSGTIVLSDTSASTKTFSGGGLAYNDLKINAASTASDVVTITGANTFNRIYTDGGGTKSIKLPGSTTTTIVSGEGLANGTNVITFTASSGSATVSKSSGVLAWDYVSLTNIPSTGGATFYAGANSTDGGGNTNWIFANAPQGGGAGEIKHNLLLLVG